MHQDMALDFKVGSAVVRLKPRQTAAYAFIEGEVESPIGPVKFQFSMARATYFKLYNLVTQRRIIPRLSDLLQGNFGFGIVGIDRTHYDVDAFSKG